MIGRSDFRGLLKLLVLLILNKERAHGYGIMQKIEELTGGLWRPTSGSVYPLLAELEQAGLIRRAEKRGRRIVYEITERGREVVAIHASMLLMVFDRLTPLLQEACGIELSQADVEQKTREALLAEKRRLERIIRCLQRRMAEIERMLAEK